MPPLCIVLCGSRDVDSWRGTSEHTAYCENSRRPRSSNSKLSNSFKNLTLFCSVGCASNSIFTGALCSWGWGRCPFRVFVFRFLFSAVRSTCAHRRRSGGQSRTPVPVKAYCTTPFTTSPDSCTSRMQWCAHVRTRARARFYDYAHRIVGSGGEVEDPDV